MLTTDSACVTSNETGPSITAVIRLRMELLKKQTFLFHCEKHMLNLKVVLFYTVQFYCDGGREREGRYNSPPHSDGSSSSNNSPPSLPALRNGRQSGAKTGHLPPQGGSSSSSAVYTERPAM